MADYGPPGGEESTSATPVILMAPTPEKPHLLCRFLKWLLLGGLFASLMGAIGLFAAWDDADALQRRVCVSWDWSRDWAQERENLCKPRYLAISEVSAERAIDTFLHAAAVGHAEDALDLLGTRYQSPDARQRFLDDWEDATIAERVDRVSVSNFNEFSTTVRVFSAPGQGWLNRFQNMDEREFRVRLQLTSSGDVLFTRFFSGSSLDGRRYEFPLMRFNSDTKARQYPSQESKFTAFTDVKKGSVLRGLCYLPKDGTYWMQTYGGWFPESDFDLIEFSSQDDPFQCSSLARSHDPVP